MSRVVTSASFAPAAVSLCPPEPPMIAPSVPVATLTLKSRSTSAAPRIIVSSWSTTAPRSCGFAYIEADICWWAGFRRNDSTARRSKHCTSSSVRKSPASSMSTIIPVIPPAAKPPRTPFRAMTSARRDATARDTPPAPVWKEKPSASRPDASMTRAAVSAIRRPTGWVVGRVVPEAICRGSPMDSTATTWSTRSCAIWIGQFGKGTRLSVTATTRPAWRTSAIG